jgi:hypothetical protein
LRLELILPSAASSPISAISFELLAAETSFLFYAGRASLVRCVRDLEPRRAAIRRGDRLVVAWANPTNIDGRFDDAVFQQHETAVSAAIFPPPRLVRLRPDRYLAPPCHGGPACSGESLPADARPGPASPRPAHARRGYPPTRTSSAFPCWT